MFSKSACSVNFFILPLLLLLLFGCSQEPVRGQFPQNVQEIADLNGRSVLVSRYPQRIAAMTGPSYEMVFMLGAADRITIIKGGHTTNFPLALLTNPDLANFVSVGANPNSSVNIEDYLRHNIDLVLYYANDIELRKFDAVNMPAIVVSMPTGLVTTLEDVRTQTIDEYIESALSTVNMVATALGGEALERFAAWEKYNREKITMLYERTKNLTDDQRKTVYWGNSWGENILATYDIKTRYFGVRLSGGILVGPLGIGGNFPEVTAEQLFTWNPDIILVDNHGSFPDLVIEHMYRENSRWTTLQAVQNRRLYRIPAGVFFLDRGTTTTLMLQWLATVIQPELFTDIDIAAEIRFYYREFYSFELDDAQVQSVLEGWHQWTGTDSWR
jgi:iron complex transport system substrate-binding protein